MLFDSSSSLQRDKIKDNKEKIKLNKQLPWLVGNVVEVSRELNEGDPCVSALLKEMKH